MGSDVPPFQLSSPEDVNNISEYRYSKDSCGINIMSFYSTTRCNRRFNVLFQPSRVVAEAGLGVEAMRAQHWSLASQHGLCRLVTKVAPHHRPVQQPKAFCRYRNMTEADQLRGSNPNWNPHTRASTSAQEEGTRADPLRPVVRGWPGFARVSPLAHMLIIQFACRITSFFQQSACDSKLYHVPLYLTPTVSRVRYRDRLYTHIMWRFRLADRRSMQRSINSGLGGKLIGFEMLNLGCRMHSSGLAFGWLAFPGLLGDA